MAIHSSRALSQVEGCPESPHVVRSSLSQSPPLWCVRIAQMSATVCVSKEAVALPARYVAERADDKVNGYPRVIRSGDGVRLED